MYGSKSTPEPPPDRGSILPNIHPVAPPPSKQLLGQIAEKAIRSRESEERYGTVSKGTETRLTANGGSAPSQPSKLVRRY